MHGNAFYEIAAILGVATLLSFVGQKLRQPMVIIFLAAGILAGPAGLGIVQSYDQIELLASVGIALLLFIVGLNLDLHLIRTTGPVALATGLGQIIFTSTVGLALALFLGMAPMNAAYVAVALTFSSTIIIVKLLSDKNEIDSLHGQIAIGFLIVQDIAAILALVVLTTFGSRVSAESSAILDSVLIVVKGAGLLAVVGVLMRYVLPAVSRRMSRSQELLALFAISWAVFLGAASEYLGFSKEVGAFLAGVSLASTGYRDPIISRLTGLRDFLLLFFFINLGARLDWSTVGSQVGLSLVFSFFVLVGNPVIVMIIMGYMGYRRRTSFMAGLLVAQISEFSLIVAALGLDLGHINPETMGLITLVGVVTIFVSTYMILYSEPLYRALSGALAIFERKNPYREAAADSAHPLPELDVILVGLGKYGSSLCEFLRHRSMKILGVDFDPAALEYWRGRGLSVLYGDIADLGIYEQLPLARARWIISTVRSKTLNLELVNRLRDRGYRGKLALTATSDAEGETYANLGVHVVFRPFRDAAEQAADSLSHAMDVLPETLNWPIAFREVRIKSGAAFAGKQIRDIPLRAATGVSILAVTRAGKVHLDPGPDFQVYPNDRLVLAGTTEDLRHAEEILGQLQPGEEAPAGDSFEVMEINLADSPELAGKTLADLEFRQKYNVTVVGIQRGEQQITTPSPRELLAAADKLLVIGAAQAVQALREARASLQPFQPAGANASGSGAQVFPNA